MQRYKKAPFLTLLLSMSLLAPSLCFAEASIGATKPIGETTLLALDGYYACVDVRLKDGKDYPFIVDTGAAETLVLQAFDAAQGFRVLDRYQMTSAGTRSRTKYVDLGEVIVGGARWPQINALVISLNRLPCAPGIDAVGALGMDFLAKPVVEFDFPGRKMRLYQPKTFRYRGKSEPIQIMKRKNQHNSLRVPVMVTTNAQQYNMRFTLDTGAPNTMLTLAFTAASQLNLFDNLHIVSEGGGASGERYAQIVTRVSEVQFGADRMANVAVTAAKAQRGALATRDGDSGLLGLQWAKHRRWVMHYPAGKIWVEPGAEIAPQKFLGANTWFEQQQPENPKAPWILKRAMAIRCYQRAFSLVMY
jgi:predicted aspartyl protease